MGCVTLEKLTSQKRLLPDINQASIPIWLWWGLRGEHKLTSQHWGSQQFTKVNDIQTKAHTVMPQKSSWPRLSSGSSPCHDSRGNLGRLSRRLDDPWHCSKPHAQGEGQKEKPKTVVHRKTQKGPTCTLGFYYWLLNNITFHCQEINYIYNFKILFLKINLWLY